jgi:predicted Zn-ribbon and HTH transcriptional regulator
VASNYINLYETRSGRERLLKEVGRPLTAYEISAELGITPQEVYEHLRHLARSVYSRSGGGEVLLMVPPRCRRCGYVFKDLGSPRKPGRCPRCRSEWIEPSRFTIGKVG